ncbi:hypothetical protein CSHISOI_03849, partial [Colletotrichum shisoi]
MVPEALKAAVIEMWVEYAVGVLVLFLRIFTRFSRVVGWKWQGDDYLAIAAVIFFTFEVMMCQIIVEKGSITGMTDEVALTLTPEEYKSHEVGAKWLFAAWYIYVSMIWSLKGIMLFFFARVTKTLPEERLVRMVSVVTVAGYLATLGVVAGHCRPMHKLWQVYPYSGVQVLVKRLDRQSFTEQLQDRHHDHVHSHPVVVEAPNHAEEETGIRPHVLRRLLHHHLHPASMHHLLAHPPTPERLDLGLNWSIRETVVAIICTNAPSIKPLFPSRKTGSANTSTPSGPGLVTFGGSGGTHKMSRIKGSHQKLDDTSVGSQEHIVNPKGTRNQTTAFADDHSSDDGANYNRGIQVTKEYTVEVGRLLEEGEES